MNENVEVDTIKNFVVVEAPQIGDYKRVTVIHDYNLVCKHRSLKDSLPNLFHDKKKRPKTLHHENNNQSTLVLEPDCCCVPFFQTLLRA